MYAITLLRIAMTRLRLVLQQFVHGNGSFFVMYRNQLLLYTSSLVSQFLVRYNFATKIKLIHAIGKLPYNNRDINVKLKIR